MFDRCRGWRSLLTCRAEGVLSPGQRALLDDHISKCAPCRKLHAADEALRSYCFAPGSGSPAGGARTFDDSVISELRAAAVAETDARGWRDRVRAYAECVSFEFCMQLAGGGLAAASITAFLLVSALNPVSTAKRLSAYEYRSISTIERYEPPVPLESLFQSATPRAAMLWAAPGRSLQSPQSGRQIAPAPEPVRRSRGRSLPGRRHGARVGGASMG